MGTKCCRAMRKCFGCAWRCCAVQISCDYILPKASLMMPSIPGFAALRAPHPFPLAAWALANYLKLTALRESLSLRDLGRWPTSLPRLRRGVAKEKENQLSSELDADFLFLLRRGRDSNPRSISAQQFSRLP